MSRIVDIFLAIMRYFFPLGQKKVKSLGWKYLFAVFISRVFGVGTLLPLILFFVVFASPTPDGFLYPLLPILTLTNFLIPVAFFVYCIRKGKVSDWDATDVKERPLPYTVTLVCWFIGLIVTNFLGGSLLFLLMLVATTLLAVLTFITFFYKISVHAALNTGVYILINYLYNWKFWWVFPLILVVCWSRWELKKHTLTQLVFGVVVAAVLEITLFW